MKTAVTRDLAQIRAHIEDFLKSARQPALLEPGEELLPLTAENYALEMRGSRLTLQAWDRTRNWSRRLTAVTEATNARLALTVEHFARREGQMFLLDLGRRSGAELSKRSGRLVFRERFRLFLRRQFPEWTLAEVSAEADLEHSLSPAFPRAYLKHGQHGWAAIACPPDGDAAAVLSFGLIWLTYLRTRERRVALEGLALYIPAGQERAAALRLLCLDPAVRPLRTLHLHRTTTSCCASTRAITAISIPASNPAAVPRPTSPNPGSRSPPSPAWSASPNTMDAPACACAASSSPNSPAATCSSDSARAAPPATHHAPEIARLAEELDRARSAGADTAHPLYRQYPEAWLESQARAEIETLDATLRRDPIYGQVPAFAGGDRGVLDLLAVDHTGRLTVVELKASADLHLPLQALDYWVRVKWHLDRARVFRQRLLPRHRTAPRCAAPAAGLPIARIPPRHRDLIELFRTRHRGGAHRPGGRMA